MACGAQMIWVTGAADALPRCALPPVQHRVGPTLVRSSPGALAAQWRPPPWHRLVASRSLRGPSAWQYYPALATSLAMASRDGSTIYHVAANAVHCPPMRRTLRLSGRRSRTAQGCSEQQNSDEGSERRDHPHHNLQSAVHHRSSCAEVNCPAVKYSAPSHLSAQRTAQRPGCEQRERPGRCCGEGSFEILEPSHLDDLERQPQCRCRSLQ